MRGLPTAVALLGAADGGAALDASAVEAVVAALLKQSVEKIDKMRQLAGVTLRALVLGAPTQDLNPSTPLLPPRLIPHRGTYPTHAPTSACPCHAAAAYAFSAAGARERRSARRGAACACSRRTP